MKIELKPYTAITILSFLRGFVDRDEERYELQGLVEPVNEYEMQVISNITTEELEDAINETKINALIGKSPDIRQ